MHRRSEENKIAVAESLPVAASIPPVVDRRRPGGSKWDDAPADEEEDLVPPGCE